MLARGQREGVLARSEHDHARLPLIIIMFIKYPLSAAILYWVSKISLVIRLVASYMLSKKVFAIHQPQG